MVDIVDKATRSRMMSGIRGKNTRPERVVRAYLHSAGLRFRLHAKDLLARPDIVFKSRKAVVFVHGCFWHRHRNCRFAYTPKSRRAFWLGKFKANVARDAAVRKALEAGGWRVMTIWECELSNTRVLEKLARGISTLPKSRRSIK